jgi:predicted RNA binding protein YcfA (HicA-like mRNA interferase family)
MQFEKAKQILNQNKEKKYTDEEIVQIIQLLEVFKDVWITNLLKLTEEVKQWLRETYTKDKKFVDMVDKLMETTTAASSGAFTVLFGGNPDKKKDIANPDYTPVKIQLSHNGTGGRSGKNAEAIAKFDSSLTSTNVTTVITGPSHPGYFKHSAEKFIVYTFHPGEPIDLGAEMNIDEISQALGGVMTTTVDKAKQLGFKTVKQVESLNEYKKKHNHKKI